MREGSKRIWTVPNALTMLRLLLIPLYWSLMAGGQTMRALIVFVAASLTDLLDGFIARHFNQITDFGKLFDPLADKLMVLSVMTSLALAGLLPLTALVLLLLKELLMMIGSCLMLRHELIVYSKPLGKIAQFTLVLALISCFFADEFTGFPLHLALTWLGIALAYAAFFFYLNDGIKALKAKEAKR